VAAVAIAVQLEAFGVSSEAQWKKADATSTLLPAAIALKAEESIVVRDTAWNPSKLLIIVTLVDICEADIIDPPPIQASI
jgi:hypothetical protein